MNAPLWLPPRLVALLDQLRRDVSTSRAESNVKTPPVTDDDGEQKPSGFVHTPGRHFMIARELHGCNSFHAVSFSSSSSRSSSIASTPDQTFSQARQHTFAPRQKCSSVARYVITSGLRMSSPMSFVYDP